MAEVKKINLEELNQVGGGYATVKGNGYVNCRMEPDINSEVLQEIPGGTEVYPTGISVDDGNITWQQVKLPGAVGEYWIAGNLIK